MRTAPVTGGQDIPPLPDSVYIGRIYGLALVGHSMRPGYNGPMELQDRVIACIEIPSQKIVIEDEEVVRTINWQGKFSMNAKASFRKFVNAVRGKDLTDDEAGAFDVSKLVLPKGVVCMFDTVLNKDKTYGNIKNMQKPIDPQTGKRYELPALSDPTKLFVYDVVEHLQRFQAGETYDRENDFIVMPDWIKREVGKSDEGKVLVEAGQLLIPEKETVDSNAEDKPAPAKSAPKPAPAKPAPKPAPAKPAPKPAAVEEDDLVL